jgi:hypothetical protein
MLMKKIVWIIGLLLLVAFWAVYAITAKSKTLADVSSPTGDWRVVVRGKQLLLGSIEVTAEVHTHDGRRISLGVIDLRPEWAETEYTYQADETLHTRIDEVKAVVGGLFGHVLIRDDYFPDESFAVSGTIEGEQVKLRIGKVNNVSFYFMTGAHQIGKAATVSVGIIDLPQQLAAGNVFEIDAAEDELSVPGVTYHWHDSQKSQNMHAGHHKNFSLRLEVHEVTEHIVTGTVNITGTDPQVDLSGRFRLVNEVPQVTRQALDTKRQ